MFNTEGRFRTVIVAFGMLVSVSSLLSAQERTETPTLQAAVLQAAPLQSAALQNGLMYPVLSRPALAPRPSALIPLYVSFGVMQALDMHSTRRALAAGGVEGNPLVATTVGSPLAMGALKAGTTAGIVFMTEKLRKKHRVAAVVMMVALDSAYAVIVSRNYQIARQ